MTRQEIIDNIRRKESFLCVGLDPDMAKLPAHLLAEQNPILTFCKAIVDATAPYAVAFKPNLAFFESEGINGWIALEETVKYIKERYPDQLVIADAKRGDIGNTSRLYARGVFEHIGADAITVAPYMGEDSVAPFLDYQGKWVILLALTSNKGSGDFQLTRDEDGRPLYERVILTSQQWAGADAMMYVVGATQGRMFEAIRAIAPDSFLLVPGVGAQGGSLEEVARYGMTADCGLLVNSSRAIIYASRGEDFAEAAAAEARNLRLQMAALLRSHNVID